MKIITLSIFVLIVFLMYGCTSDDIINPDPPNETELITTMILQFDHLHSDHTQEFIFRDVDGEGGNPPERFDTIRITADSNYSVRIILLDESNPSETDTISNEVEEEGADHQFFFFPAGVNTVIDYEDADKNGWPIGLMTSWRNGAASTGTVRTLLKHQPDEKQPPPGDPDVGETDIDLNWVTEIN